MVTPKGENEMAKRRNVPTTKPAKEEVVETKEVITTGLDAPEEVVPEPEPIKANVANCKRVRARKNPTTEEDNVLAELTEGTEVVVLDSSNPDWTRVDVNGTLAWIMSDYLTVIQEVTPMEDLRNNSILSDVRGAIGLNPDEVDVAFDLQIKSAINNSISELAQLGLGELGEFVVQDGSETWNDLLGEDYQYVYAFAKNYVEVNTRLLFDPPQSGALKAALDEQLKKTTFNVMTAIELHNVEKEA